MRIKLTTLLFLTLVLFFIRGAATKYLAISQIAFSYDEPDYVANSILFSEFHFGVSPNSSFWSQQWAYDQPHLYHFLCALFLESKYRKSITTILDQSQLNQRYAYGSPLIIFEKTGNNKIITDPDNASYQPAYQTILIARELSFFFYLASGLILLSIIFFFCHPILAIPVTFFYLHPYFFSISSLAQADGLLILLTLINTLLSLVYIKFPKQRFPLAILLGISCGLALSTKLNGGITLINSIICIWTVFSSKSKSTTITPPLYSILIILLTFIIFVWLNPYTYSNPIQKIFTMFQYRLDIGITSKLIHPDETIPPNFTHRILTVFENLYHQTNQTPLFSLILSSFSTIVSLLYIFLIFIKKIQIKPTTIFLLVSSTFSFYVVLVYIPMTWNRYYYPAIIANLFMTASVINISINLLQKHLINNKNRHHHRLIF